MTDLSEERKELENTIYENLGEIRSNLLKTADRIKLAREQMEKPIGGSARIVPENETLKQDMKEIAAKTYGANSDMDARMEDFDNLLELIEEER